MGERVACEDTGRERGERERGKDTDWERGRLAGHLERDGRERCGRGMLAGTRGDRRAGRGHRLGKREAEGGYGKRDGKERVRGEDIDRGEGC